jgi:hypothetical protein
MSMNRVQFQQGMSLTEFFERYGTEAQCAAAGHRDRQQRGRTLDPGLRARTQELTVCRFGHRWGAGCGDLQPAGHCEAQRNRPRAVSACRARAHRRASDQPRC